LPQSVGRESGVDFVKITGKPDAMMYLEFCPDLHHLHDAYRCAPISAFTCEAGYVLRILQTGQRCSEKWLLVVFCRWWDNACATCLLDASLSVQHANRTSSTWHRIHVHTWSVPSGGNVECLCFMMLLNTAMRCLGSLRSTWALDALAASPYHLQTSMWCSGSMFSGCDGRKVMVMGRNRHIFSAICVISLKKKS